MYDANHGVIPCDPSTNSFGVPTRCDYRISSAEHEASKALASANFLGVSELNDRTAEQLPESNGGGTRHNVGAYDRKRTERMPSAAPTTFNATTPALWWPVGAGARTILNDCWRSKSFAPFAEMVTTTGRKRLSAVTTRRTNVWMPPISGGKSGVRTRMVGLSELVLGSCRASNDLAPFRPTSDLRNRVPRRYAATA